MGCTSAGTCLTCTALCPVPVCPLPSVPCSHACVVYLLCCVLLRSCTSCLPCLHLSSMCTPSPDPPAQRLLDLPLLLWVCALIPTQSVPPPLPAWSPTCLRSIPALVCAPALLHLCSSLSIPGLLDLPALVFVLFSVSCPGCPPPPLPTTELPNVYMAHLPCCMLLCPTHCPALSRLRLRGLPALPCVLFLVAVCPVLCFMPCGPPPLCSPALQLASAPCSLP